MRVLILVMAMALLLWSPVAAAQSPQEIRDVGEKAEKAAEKSRAMAKNFPGYPQKFLQSDYLNVIAPEEARKVRETLIAALKAIKLQARAYDALALKLYHQAGLIEDEQEKKKH